MSGRFDRTVLNNLIDYYNQQLEQQGGNLDFNSLSLPTGFDTSWTRLADGWRREFPDGGVAFYAVNLNNPNGRLFQLNLHRSILPSTSLLRNGVLLSNQRPSLADFFYYYTATDSYKYKNSAPSLVDKCLDRQLEETLEALGYELADGGAWGSSGGSASWVGGGCGTSRPVDQTFIWNEVVPIRTVQSNGTVSITYQTVTRKVSLTYYTMVCLLEQGND